MLKGEAHARKRETAAKWASIAARNEEGAQQDGEKVYEYAQRVKGVAKDMERAGDMRDEGAVKDAFLQGLHGRHRMMKTVLEAQDGLTLAAALPRLMKEEADEIEQTGEQAMLTYSSQRFGRHPPQRGGGRQGAAGRSAAATAGGQGAYGARPEWVRGTNGLLKPGIKCYRCNNSGTTRTCARPPHPARQRATKAAMGMLWLCRGTVKGREMCRDLRS